MALSRGRCRGRLRRAVVSERVGPTGLVVAVDINDDELEPNFYDVVHCRPRRCAAW